MNPGTGNYCPRCKTVLEPEDNGCACVLREEREEALGLLREDFRRLRARARSRGMSLPQWQQRVRLVEACTRRCTDEIDRAEKIISLLNTLEGLEIRPVARC